MLLSFDDLAAHFDDQRGLPAAALREWVAWVNLTANGRAQRIVEPGIGTGRVALPLMAAGHHVTGLDISDGMLEACMQKAEQVGAADRITLIQGDATLLPLPEDGFDLGIIASLLYLVPNWEAVLDELARVVVPGGTIVHLVERTESGENLQLWDIAWRTRVEQLGYQHPTLTPSLEDVFTEFRRRWPDTHIEPLASWDFGQTVAEGRDRYSERLRPLYAGIADEDWDRVVRDFLYWSDSAFPDPETHLDGQVVLELMIARP